MAKKTSQKQTYRLENYWTDINVISEARTVLVLGAVVKWGSHKETTVRRQWESEAAVTREAHDKELKNFLEKTIPEHLENISKPWTFNSWDNAVNPNPEKGKVEPQPHPDDMKLEDTPRPQKTAKQLKAEATEQAEALRKKVEKPKEEEEEEQTYASPQSAETNATPCESDTIVLYKKGDDSQQTLLMALVSDIEGGDQWMDDMSKFDKIKECVAKMEKDKMVFLRNGAIATPIMDLFTAALTVPF